MSRIRFVPKPDPDKPVAGKRDAPPKDEKMAAEEPIAVTPAVQGGSDGASFALTPSEPGQQPKKGRRKTSG